MGLQLDCNLHRPTSVCVTTPRRGWKSTCFRKISSSNTKLTPKRVKYIVSVRLISATEV